MLDGILKNNSIKKYWKEHGLSDKDFYCRECGKLMLDIEDAERVDYVPELTGNNRFEDKTGRQRIYTESEKNIWLVRGRTLSGKTYFRHLCWHCLFKHLGEIEDIPRRARKSSWYRDINNGILRPPRPCQSPSKYFKLIFDISDKALEEEHKKFDTASLESFIRRHGEEKGNELYQKYKERQAYTCSKEYMMEEKGMNETEWNEYNANRSSTKENFIKRYGEELGLEKWNKYCEHEAYAGCKLEYFIEKYGELEGTRKYFEINRKKAVTQSTFIAIYGEEEGLKRYKKFVSIGRYSKIATKMFNRIVEVMGDKASEAKYGENEIDIEFQMDDGSFKKLCPDFILGDRIIEFNGDYWHANPEDYSPNDVMHYGKSHEKKLGGDTAKDVWEYDKKRLEMFENKGYKVKVVWEKDYRKNPDIMVGECIQFLRG